MPGGAGIPGRRRLGRWAFSQRTAWLPCICTQSAAVEPRSPTSSMQPTAAPSKKHTPNPTFSLFSHVKASLFSSSFDGRVCLAVFPPRASEATADALQYTMLLLHQIAMLSARSCQHTKSKNEILESGCGPARSFTRSLPIVWSSMPSELSLGTIAWLTAISAISAVGTRPGFPPIMTSQLSSSREFRQDTRALSCFTWPSFASSDCRRCLACRLTALPQIPPSLLAFE